MVGSVELIPGTDLTPHPLCRHKPGCECVCVCVHVDLASRELMQAVLLPLSQINHAGETQQAPVHSAWG